MDRSTFLNELQLSGLGAEESVEKCLSTQSAQALDGPGLARHLVLKEALTPYQANQLLNGKGKELLLGPYLLQERVGQGGMGQVFKAVHRKLGRVVAVKVLARHLLQDQRAAARFQREIEVVGRLSHPHIVTALDAAEEHGLKYLVMEFVEGSDLGRLVKKIGPLPLEMACHCLHQAALGLQHAHEHGLVHRDLKPTNVFLQMRWENSKANPDKKKLVYGRVKLLDLGLVGFLDRPLVPVTAGQMLTHVQEIMGTPDYMAPEQARDSRQATPQSDIYSLGATLYFCLTGQPPFSEGTPMEKLMKHQTDEPLPVEKLRPQVTPRLSRLVRRMMAKNPDQRPRTVAEVVAELKNWRRPPTVLILASAPSPFELEVPEADTLEAAAPEAQGSISTLHFEPEQTRLLRDRSFLTRSNSLLWYTLALGAAALFLIVVLVLKAVL